MFRLKLKKRLYLQHSVFTNTYSARGRMRLSKKAEADTRRDARVVEWGGLENRCPGNWTGGSNPFLSADYFNPVIPPIGEMTGIFIFRLNEPGLPG